MIRARGGRQGARGGMGRGPFGLSRGMGGMRGSLEPVAGTSGSSIPVDSLTVPQAVVRRHEMLLPTSLEHTALDFMVATVKTVVDAIVADRDEYEDFPLDEVHLVGSFKKGTIISGQNVADMVVVMHILPTKDSVDKLCNKVWSDTNGLLCSENLPVIRMRHERGFTLLNLGGIRDLTLGVCVLVTTHYENLPGLVAGVHVDPRLAWINRTAVRHAQWFGEHCNSVSIKMLVRLLRDICSRHAGLHAVNPWMIDLLGHYCIIHSLGQRQVIEPALRRALSLLASGIFEPKCAIIEDPCEVPANRTHFSIDRASQDLIAATATAVLNFLTGGGHLVVLGLSVRRSNVFELPDDTDPEARAHATDSTSSDDDSSDAAESSD